MTLEDLEREMRSAHEALIATSPFRFLATHDLWQDWWDAAVRIEPYDRIQLTSIVRKDLLRFYRAGEIYNVARDEGMDAAILFKLSQA